MPVMVILCVAHTTNKIANPRTHTELGSSQFFCCNSPLCGHDHDRCLSLSVLLQTFFYACRKVINDLKKNRRGHKNHLQWTDKKFFGAYVSLWAQHMFIQSTDQYNVLRWRDKKLNLWVAFERIVITKHNILHGNFSNICVKILLNHA